MQLLIMIYQMHIMELTMLLVLLTSHFNYTSGGTVRKSPPTGFVEYAINGYVNAGVRCGLFDFQNGFFYEYDGKDALLCKKIFCSQLAGTVTCSRFMVITLY